MRQSHISILNCHVRQQDVLRLQVSVDHGTHRLCMAISHCLQHLSHDASNPSFGQDLALREGILDVVQQLTAPGSCEYDVEVVKILEELVHLRHVAVYEVLHSRQSVPDEINGRRGFVLPDLPTSTSLLRPTIPTAVHLAQRVFHLELKAVIEVLQSRTTPRDFTLLPQELTRCEAVPKRPQGLDVELHERSVVHSVIDCIHSKPL
mmetsp:Transcript_163459/g.302029  ORF Transcript_163459/g.302029 Transcript_163459/m.302029 type:complete len:206 (+) Transcript_163459:220-837(+)